MIRKEVVKLVCSSVLLCEKVELIDIDLLYLGNDGLVVFMCKFVKLIISGKINLFVCNVFVIFSIEF